MSLEDATRRIPPPKQSLDDAYSVPTNFLEIEVCSPETHGVGKTRFTDYEVRLKTNLPIFKIKEFKARRRYSDFEWLRAELKRSVKIHLADLPGKGLLKQLPFLTSATSSASSASADEAGVAGVPETGIFGADFIEERRQGLESFINSVAGHPLVQNEKSLHLFLQEETLDKAGYVPGKVPYS